MGAGKWALGTTGPGATFGAFGSSVSPHQRVGATTRPVMALRGWGWQGGVRGVPVQEVQGPQRALRSKWDRGRRGQSTPTRWTV